VFWESLRQAEACRTFGGAVSLRVSVGGLDDKLDNPDGVLVNGKFPNGLTHLIWETLNRQPVLDKRVAAKASSLAAFAVRGMWKWSGPSAQTWVLITRERISPATANITM